jgi:hypothetical protein
MVGNMCGTPLAMAPAFLVAQACRYVDLDGPLLQRRDREPSIRFESSVMHPPDPASRDDRSRGSPTETTSTRISARMCDAIRSLFTVCARR